MTCSPRHILIVEDNPEYGRWLADVVRNSLPGAVVACAASIAGAREYLAAVPPDPHIALIDLCLPDGSGADLIRDIAVSQPWVTPVVSTIFDDDSHLFDALAAGAQGYMLKGADAPEIVDHLLRIEAGWPAISPAIARRMLAHFRQNRSEPTPRPTIDADLGAASRLTPRELDVLRYIGRGLRISETARLLDLTDNTIAGYVKTLYRKLNISSRAEAALEAAKRGLV